MMGDEADGMADREMLEEGREDFGAVTDRLPQLPTAPRSKRERIERLRARLRDIKPPNTTPQVVGVLQGVLDLLADEL